MCQVPWQKTNALLEDLKKSYKWLKNISKMAEVMFNCFHAFKQQK